MAHHRATFAEINLETLRRNLRAVRSLLDPACRVMAVVKADAYGHGAVPCARAALEAGADALGVAVIEEGIELRENGITAPILVLCGIFPDEAEDLVQHRLSTIISDPAVAGEIAKKASQAEKAVGVHIKIDTGMSRLGVSLDHFLPLVEHVRNLGNLNLEGVSTHFASADGADPEFTRLQLSRFQKALDQLREEGIDVPQIHCANTAALLRFPESRYSMVRPGLILYGALPSPHLKPKLQTLFPNDKEQAVLPVMQWKSTIAQINRLPRGTPLSYGGQYVTPRDSRIAVLPVGYADGLHRGLSNRMEVLVHGKRVSQVGTICMDLCLIDVTEAAEARPGDEVVLIGVQGKQSITAEEMAGWGETIPYEVFCAVGKRVPRRYLP